MQQMRIKFGLGASQGSLRGLQSRDLVPSVPGNGGGMDERGARESSGSGRALRLLQYGRGQGLAGSAPGEDLDGFGWTVGSTSPTSAGAGQDEWDQQED